ncbi:MAG: hypothetical protein R2825_21995 [Saprospiraceae bacterium]
MTQFHLLVCGCKDKRIVPIETIHHRVAEGTVSFVGVTEDVRPFSTRPIVLCCHPTTERGFPRTTSKRPVWAFPSSPLTTVAVAARVIPRENGFCSPQNPEELAHKMLEFIELPLEKRKNGRTRTADGTRSI